MNYDGIYLSLYQFANYHVWDVLLCRMMAPVILIMLLFISRIVSSVAIKFFSVIIALLLYFLPEIVSVFA